MLCSPSTLYEYTQNIRGALLRMLKSVTDQQVMYSLCAWTIMKFLTIFYLIVAASTCDDWLDLLFL